MLIHGHLSFSHEHCMTASHVWETVDACAYLLHIHFLLML